RVAARVAAAAAALAALRLGAEPGEPVRIDARTAHAAAPLRAGPPRTVRDVVRDDRVAGEHRRHPRLAPAGHRAALGRRADPARRVSDRRIADPRGASMGSAAARRDRPAHHWAARPQAGPAVQWLAFWNAICWLLGLAFVLWIASNHVPEIREFV